MLALVTWAQRDDPHWFGAKIPSTVQSVEFVTIQPAAGANPTYEHYKVLSALRARLPQITM